MRENGFKQLKAFTLYTKTLVMMSSLSDENIGMIVRMITDYYSGKARPDTDDIDNAAVSMLIDELCSCIDNAEKKRQRNSDAGKKAMASRYSEDVTGSQPDPNQNLTPLEFGYNQTLTTKTKTSTKTKTNTKDKDNNTENVSLSIIDASSDNSDAAAGKRQKSDDNIAYFVIKMYNSICVSLPEVKKISQRRINNIKARLKLYSIDDFCTVFTKAEQSRFLKGGGSQNFIADFDWLTRDSYMAKVIDGKYDDDPNGNYQQKLPDSNFTQQMRMLEEYRQRFLAEERMVSNDQV